MSTNEKRRKKSRSSDIAPPGATGRRDLTPTASSSEVPTPKTTQTNLTSVTAAARLAADREESDKKRRIAFLFLIGAFLLVAVAFGLKRPEKRVLNKEEMTSLSEDRRTLKDTIYNGMPKNFDRRVEGHIDRVGTQLNRERIRAQQENLGLAQPLPGQPELRDDPVLHGVPLDGEKHPYQSLVPNNSRVNRSAEAEIIEHVQLAKDLDQWEHEARETYIREFIANARAQGYKVRIDKDYNVEYAPMSEAERRPQGSSLGGAE